MRGLLRFVVVVGLLAVWCAAAPSGFAKGPKGGGGFKGGGAKGGSFKGGGAKGGSFKGGGAQGGSFKGSGHQGGLKGGGFDRQPTLAKSPKQALDGASGDHPWSKQRLVEERKLAHRKGVADHLRDLSERNGNENLKDVADRMEQKAQEHYDKRLAKINEKDGLDDLDDPLDDVDNPLDDPLDDPLDGADDLADDLPDPADSLDQPLDELASDAGEQIDQIARKLTGRENALYRQLRNEERKFAQRMQTVDQLRQLAESTGDAQFLDAADRLEAAALNHYEQRLTRITSFQERFNLPDVSEFLPSLPSVPSLP